MDWLRFFDDYNIDYITRGQNVKKGNVNVACPLCGDDPSYHLGVHLDSERWGCWRSANHAGKKAHNLIKHLLNCSYMQARVLAKQYSRSDPESLEEAYDAFISGTGDDKQPAGQRTLTVPPDLKIVRDRSTTRRFFNYLWNRGFKKDTTSLIEYYRLMCATSGTWKDRVVIPIYMNKKLVGWTSRALTNPVNAPRYLALSEEQGALINIFHSVYNYDKIKKGGDVLIITEGVFDAMKVDFYSKKYKVRATCTFGTSMSNEQAMLLGEISRKFRKTILLYDQNAVEAIFAAEDKLSHVEIETASLPDGIEDPGDLSKKQVEKLIHKFI